MAFLIHPPIDTLALTYSHMQGIMQIILSAGGNAMGRQLTRGENLETFPSFQLHGSLAAKVDTSSILLLQKIQPRPSAGASSQSKRLQGPPF